MTGFARHAVVQICHDDRQFLAKSRQWGRRTEWLDSVSNWSL